MFSTFKNHIRLVLAVVGCSAAATFVVRATPAADPTPPATPVRLIFIHHSTGENWLADDNGGLGIALRDANYFVSDTNYGWGPDDIGSLTAIPHRYLWFTGPNRDTYLAALYAEDEQHSTYSRLDTNPGGENRIKSCFPNANLGGNPDAPLPITPTTTPRWTSPTPNASTWTCCPTLHSGRTTCSSSSRHRRCGQKILAPKPPPTPARSTTG